MRSQRFVTAKFRLGDFIFRFVDALTPTVANLHPLTVINHLHTSCVGQVESANILKTTENVAKLCQTSNTDGGPIVSDGIYEETVKTQLQAAIFLPKVCIKSISEFLR